MVIKHFSHKHALSPYEIEEENSLTYCSICGLEMVPNSQTYTCKKPGSSCEFHIHKHCSELQREIQHASHPQHPLTLLPEPPSSFFNCHACAGFCFSFVYSCAACEFAVHVHCSSLAESVQREDHQHPLELAFFLRPKRKEDEEGEEEIDSCCRVCGFYVLDERWAYLCRECGYVTHLECVTAEAEGFAKEEEQEEELNFDSEKEEVKEDQEEEAAEEEENPRDSGGEEEEELKEEQEEENGGDGDGDGDGLDVIARNQERIIMQQTMFNNQMHLMRMQMHRQMINNNTKRLFHFGL